MKKFTVKDFITYNNPCFSCGESILFRIGVYLANGDIGYIRPTVMQGYTVIDLKVSYNNRLQLLIFHQSNKIISSNITDLTDYINSNQLFLSSHCNKCFSTIDSEQLEFNLEDSFIKPVSLATETIFINDESNAYHIYTSFENDKSSITVDKNDKSAPPKPIRFKSQAMPLHKFKNKEHFINKLKTYIIFS
jgi:hypothetical protein